MISIEMLGVIVGAVILLFIGVYYFFGVFKRKLVMKIKKEIRQEIVKEYKIKELRDGIQTKEIVLATNVPHKTYTKKHEQVTVLFADIQGFTKIVELINPELLIDELDKLFFRFDEAVEKYGIEKIKTIGDAYMCAGGIPLKNRTNPVEVVLAALEMQHFMKNLVHPLVNEKTQVWELRIGIHTGSVVSGMIGRKKIAFDIWGDTVNIASRMESSGIAGEVNITGVTYQYVKDLFVCQYRGKMPIKYKGETDMYFVKSIRPELSINGDGLIPNDIFNIRLQHLRFGDLEEFILDRLRTELPSELYYHNVNHTIDVVTRVEILGRAEKLTDEELLLVKTAALLHDTGFLFQCENHEENSKLIAREVLPKYKYSESQIECISNLIEVTKKGIEPDSLIQMVLIDADLDYLGRSDYMILASNLYREKSALKEEYSQNEWEKLQYEFILNHRYYTNSARRLRQVNKNVQMEKLRALVNV